MSIFLLRNRGWLIPNHKQIMGLRDVNVKGGMSQSIMQDENEMKALIQEIVVQATNNSDKVVWSNTCIG